MGTSKTRKRSGAATRDWRLRRLGGAVAGAAVAVSLAAGPATAAVPTQAAPAIAPETVAKATKSVESGTITLDYYGDDTLVIHPTDGVEGNNEGLSIKDCYPDTKRIHFEGKVTITSPRFNGLPNLTSVTAEPGAVVVVEGSLSSLFEECELLTNISGLASWDTSKITEMGNAFHSCKSLTDLTSLGSWDTSLVKSMSGMFNRCSSIRSASPLGSWDVSNVEDMDYMFEFCTSLTDISGLASWSTSTYPNMYFMFHSCEQLTDATAVGSWRGHGHLAMGMFNDCPINIISFGSKWEFRDQYDTVIDCWSIKQPIDSGTTRIWVSDDAEERGPFEDSLIFDQWSSRRFGTWRALIVKKLPNYIDISDQDWTGRPVTPKPALYIANKELVEGVDYTVSYSNNVDPGTATAIITGIGDYYGSIESTFRIVKKPSLAGATLEAIPNQIWAGSWVEPQITVILDGQRLSEWNDYTVSYSNNRDPGTATVTVTGTGAYTGSKSVTFKIFKPNTPTEPMKPTEPSKPATPATPSKPAGKAQWIQSGSRWWYRHADGSYTRNGWERVGGKWYLFDGAGWMRTGWASVGGSWYYLDPSGAMAEGWRKVGGAWYWLRPGSGAMATGWYQAGGSWYWSATSGAMEANRWVGNYYLTGSGAMATNTWVGRYWVDGSGRWTRTR